MNGLEREARLLSAIRPTLDEVEADMSEGHFGAALTKAARRLVTLSLATFKEAGVEFSLADGTSSSDHDFGLLVAGLASAADAYLADYDGAPPDQLIAASDTLDRADDLLRSLAGAEVYAEPSDRIAAIAIAALSLGQVSMLLGGERLGFARKASLFEDRSGKTARAVAKANERRKEHEKLWQAALDRYATKDLLASEGNNTALARAFCSYYGGKHSGRRPPASEHVARRIGNLRRRPSS